MVNRLIISDHITRAIAVNAVTTELNFLKSFKAKARYNSLLVVKNV
jgi:hypothetical protein